MKKGLLIVMTFVLIVITGCVKVEEQGNYKVGTYFGSFVDNGSVATAVVYVDDNGYIKSVYLDTTYEKDEILTTKKTLGEEYGMKAASPISKEWFEQVGILENKIITEQGLDWIKWTDEDKTETDSVSGVTMKINALYKAVDGALKQSKEGK